MDVLKFIATIAVLVVGGYGIYRLVLWLMQKRSADLVDPEDLQGVIRKVQVVDVRDPDEFRAGHILGARNIPFGEFVHRVHEIRKDKPVYLYDDNNHFAPRAANQLRKVGHKQVFIIKGGFEKWPGKRKSNL